MKTKDPSKQLERGYRIVRFLILVCAGSFITAMFLWGQVAGWMAVSLVAFIALLVFAHAVGQVKKEREGK